MMSMKLKDAAIHAQIQRLTDLFHTKMSAKCAITDDGGNMKCRATLKAGLASVICVASLKATVPQPEVIQSKQFVYSFLEV